MPQEASLPFVDRIDIGFANDFYYSAERRLFTYEDLLRSDIHNLGNFTLYANRIISFDYVVSSSATFNGMEQVFSGQVNTVDANDFINSTTSKVFYNSFYDPNLELWLTTYKIDNDSDYDLSTSLSTGNSLAISFSGYDGNSYFAGDNDLPMVFDASSLPVNDVPIDIGRVYSITTSNGGYALLKVKNIHIMTESDMLSSIKEPEIQGTEIIGAIWLTPRGMTVQSGSDFITTLVINTGEQILTAYGINIFFDNNIIGIDTHKGKNGLEVTDQGFIAAINIKTPGKMTVSGFNTNATIASTHFELFRIHWKALNKGISAIAITCRTLVNPEYNMIGSPQGLKCAVTIE